MAARGGAAGKASGGGQGSLQVKVKNGKSLAPGDVFIRLIPGSGQGARDSVKGKKKKKLQTTVKKKAQHQNWDEQFDDIDYEEGMVLTVEVCHKSRFKEPLVPAVHNLDIASLHLVNLSPKDHTIEFLDGSSLDLTLVVDDGESLFGLSIGLAAKREKQDIPTIVTTCIDTITRGPRGLKIEGLYRIPGKASAIKEFKAAFNASHEYKFKDGINPNWIASLLKQYFRDLPDPLFTTNLYADFIACVPKGADSADINGISSIVAKMPKAHRETFQYLFKHLLDVVREPTNKMTEKSLATCFGPTLLNPPSGGAPLSAGMMVASQKQNDVVEAILRNPEVFEKDEGQYQMLNPDNEIAEVYEGHVAQPLMQTDEEVFIIDACNRNGGGGEMGFAEFKAACYDLGHFNVNEAFFKEEVTLSGRVGVDEFVDWFKGTASYRKFAELEKQPQRAFKETIEYFRKYDKALTGRLPEAEFSRCMEDLNRTSEYGIPERALKDIILRSPTGPNIAFEFVFFEFIALSADSNTQCKYTSARGVCTNLAMNEFCALHYCSKCHQKKQSNLTFCRECGGTEEAEGRVQADSAEECAYKSRNGHCNSAHMPDSKFCRHHACPKCPNQKSSRTADCGC